MTIFKKGSSFLGLLLGVAVVFFVLSLAVAAFLFFQGTNVVSSNNIDILTSGPISVRGGEEFNLLINIANNNSSDLKYSTLTIEYPSGSKTTEGDQESRFTKFLGDIKAGQMIKEDIKSVVYGEEGGQREIKITLEYRTDNSNAIFVRETSYKTSISSSPAAVELILPEKVTSGQEVSFDVNVSHNGDGTLTDVAVEAAYPPGFTFKKAIPSPSYGYNFW
ncbi:MAG: hypothetical protein WC797_04680, partial [Candidatus Paceibacterota bacterium]